jgi:hypothetical protein
LDLQDSQVLFPHASGQALQRSAIAEIAGGEADGAVVEVGRLAG